jgi:hypothetical protein
MRRKLRRKLEIYEVGRLWKHLNIRIWWFKLAKSMCTSLHQRGEYYKQSVRVPYASCGACTITLSPVECIDEHLALGDLHASPFREADLVNTSAYQLAQLWNQEFC